ncbi:hypothetical protein [Paenibacillus puerhi]|uniref:hypothetical protein n=1 Tax=Paenibacillus puerhi TaxID=2692622 RepID=UPI00135C98E6|nr:hypothetical protein [Paenibacillus puerhi]
MDNEDKKIADKVLKHLCLGARIDGIRFGGILQMLITDHDSNEYEKGIKGQVYINLASRWCVFESMPATLPHNEDAIEDLTQEEEIKLLCTLREKKIADIFLGESEPHLIITLDNGEVFFLNGHDEQYESWQLGVAFNPPNENWLVVACPDDTLAVWYPNYFS